MEKLPKIAGERLLLAGRFLAFKILEWVDAGGVRREWESAERIHFPGAVFIVPRLVPSDRLLLIRQFRPPARTVVVEFPAGIMDAGESPAAAALRELREETGYTAARLSVSPAAFSTPGMTNEAVFMVTAEIEENAPENRHPSTNFDPAEQIETILVRRIDLPGFYRREAAAGNAFDSKVAAYAMGMESGGTER